MPQPGKHTLDHPIRLATRADAFSIAEMSRDYIERGLAWRWTPARVARSIADPATNVAVAHESSRLAGFGIMKYRADEAHLFLLAVHAVRRRRGLGSSLLSWLEATADAAGIGVIYLEARAGNTSARRFYRKHGYREMALLPGRYYGVEDGVRIAKDLWAKDCA